MFDIRGQVENEFQPRVISGITGFGLKNDNFVKHSKSKMHFTAVNLAHKLDSVKKIIDTPIGKALFQASNEKENKVVH